MISSPSPKANAAAFIDLFEQLHPFEFALLRERMITMMQVTKEGAINDPLNYTNILATPTDYVSLADKVITIIGFE